MTTMQRLLLSPATADATAEGGPSPHNQPHSGATELDREHRHGRVYDHSALPRLHEQRPYRSGGIAHSDPSLSLPDDGLHPARHQRLPGDR